MNTQLSADSFGVLILENAMAEFADKLGNELNSRWHPQSQAPTLPMDVAGAKSVCNSLRNGKVKDGHNPGLKLWIPYWGSNTTPRWNWSQVQPVLEQIGEARNDVNHKADTPLDVSRVTAVVQGMVLVYTELQLDASVLQALLVQLQHLATQQNVSVSVTAEERGGMRMPFTDPRKYLVGRQPLISSVAGHLRSQPWARVLLHGESGTGKTVAAIATAFEVCYTPCQQHARQELSICVCAGERAVSHPAVYGGQLR